MNSLTDLNNLSGQVFEISDNRSVNIVYTGTVVSQGNLYQHQSEGIWANTDNYATWVQPFNFSKFENGGGGYFNFNYQGSVTGPNEGVLTTGFKFSINLDVSSGSAPTEAEFLKMQKAVSFAGVEMAWGGTAVRLTNVGSGNMYAVYGATDFSGGGSPIRYEYTVFGIKNINDWNLIRNPTIYVGSLNQSGAGLSYAYSTIKTAYRTDVHYQYVHSYDGTNITTPRIPTVYSDATNANLLNFAVDRQVFANVAGQFICDNWIPKISDSGSSTYISNVTVTGGNIGTGFSPNSSVASFTGNVSTTNTRLRTLIFDPTVGVSGTKTINFNIKKDGVAYVNTSADVDIVANTTILSNTYIITSTQTFYPTAQEKTRLCDILIVGGGQWGNTKQTASTGTAGGGLAGEVVANVGLTLSDSSYTISIGQAGGGGYRLGNTWQLGRLPGNSYVTGSTSGNITTAYSAGYGTSGNLSGNASTGGRWRHSSGTSSTYGGGGGGAKSAGTNGTTTQPGQGGAGLTSSDFYLVGQVTGGVGKGGNGSSSTGANPGGYGAGGNGNSYPNNYNDGTPGIVVLRFY